MLTVMFPTGVRVTYNDANYLVRGEASWNLYTAKDGTWVASIQCAAGVIIEATSPCAITAPPMATVKSALALIVNELSRSTVTGWDEMVLLRDLKSKLSRFDARGRVWK
jgi:hypothetical protein